MSFTFAELFSGIGGFRTALEPLGGECVFASEIDKYAIQSYKAIFGDTKELHGDITKIKAADIPDHDLLVAGFPCQSFSVAGNQRGFEDTRGTMFFEVARIAQAKEPKWMLLENVKGLVSHDQGRTLQIMLRVLDSIGYAVDFTVLNSKCFGVPQNRERIFIMCSRDAKHEAWDIQGTGMLAKAKRHVATMGIRTFNFPWPTNNQVITKLRDVLESNVDERYYLNNEKTATLLAQLGKPSVVEDVICVNPRKLDGTQTYQQDRTYTTDGVMTTLSAELSGRFNIVEDEPVMILHNVYGGFKEEAPRIFLDETPTIRTAAGGGHIPSVLEKIGVIQSYGELVEREDGISTAIDANYFKGIDNHGQRTMVLEQGEIPPWIPIPDEINRTLRIGGKSTLTSKHNYDYVAEEVTGDSFGCSLRTRSYRGQAQQLEVLNEPISNTVTSVAKDAMVLEVRPVLTPDRPEKKQNGRRFKENEEESFTLTAQDRHGIAIGRAPYYRIRKLTPLECFRLQGFSDEQLYKAKSANVSDSQLYKQAGNAVTVNVIAAIGESWVKRMSNPQDEEKDQDQVDMLDLLDHL